VPPIEFAFIALNLRVVLCDLYILSQIKILLSPMANLSRRQNGRSVAQRRRLCARDFKPSSQRHRTSFFILEIWF